MGGIKLASRMYTKGVIMIHSCLDVPCVLFKVIIDIPNLQEKDLTNSNEMFTRRAEGAPAQTTCKGW